MGSPPPGPPRPKVDLFVDVVQKWADEARANGLEKLAEEMERELKVEDGEAG